MDDIWYCMRNKIRDILDVPMDRGSYNATSHILDSLIARLRFEVEHGNIINKARTLRELNRLEAVIDHHWVSRDAQTRSNC